MKRIFALILSLAGTAAAADTYTVSFMLGTASVRTADGAGWEPLMLFDRVATDDSLKLEEESRLELVGGDGSLIALTVPWQGPANPAALSRFTAAADNRSLLEKLTAETGNSAAQQPVAIAAVRGKTATDGTEDETAATEQTADDPADAYDADDDTARKLLDEAVALREQVDRLLQDDKKAAAASTLQLAEKLTRQALALLTSE